MRCAYVDTSGVGFLALISGMLYRLWKIRTQKPTANLVRSSRGSKSDGKRMLLEAAGSQEDCCSWPG